jgi:hypothetical protein
LIDTNGLPRRVFAGHRPFLIGNVLASRQEPGVFLDGFQAFGDRLVGEKLDPLAWNGDGS